MTKEELLQFKNKKITDKVITNLEADLHNSMRIVAEKNNKNKLKEYQMAVYCLREERDKLNNIIDELEKWLNENWNKPLAQIYVSDVVKKVSELRMDSNG